MHEILGSIGFQISLLLSISLLGYIIAALTSQSAIVGQIIAGIILGPSLLNMVTYNEFVNHLAHLGAVILLFVIGLEFRLGDILKVKNFVIAFFGILIPWVSGYVFSKFYGFSLTTAVFVGTALTATSIAITANVLKEYGKLRSDIGKIIIGSAVIDDVLALLVLTVASDFDVSTLQFVTISIIILKASAFLVGAAVIGQYVFVPLIYRIDNSIFAREYTEFVFILAMVIAFSYSIIAELMGLSAVVGAFTAGAIMEGIKLKHSRSFSDGADYLRIIFASIFFTSLGILVNLHEVSMADIPFIIGLTGVAIASKLFGCMLPALAMRIPFKNSLIIGVGMIPRGEIAMVVAILGLKKELINQSIYVALVVMALITTLIVPYTLRYFISKDKDPTSSPIPL